MPYFSFGTSHFGVCISKTVWTQALVEQFLTYGLVLLRRTILFLTLPGYICHRLRTSNEVYNTNDHKTTKFTTRMKYLSVLLCCISICYMVFEGHLELWVPIIRKQMFTKCIWYIRAWLYTLGFRKIYKWFPFFFVKRLNHTIIYLSKLFAADLKQKFHFCYAIHFTESTGYQY